MLTLADILKPRHVDLALGTKDLEQGIESLARRLEGDAGMLNWTAFRAALKQGAKPIGAHSFLSHIRTDHVSTMLMAAGRLSEERPGSGTPANNSVENVHFLFLIAVPMTLASEYLRMVGALARSLRNPAIVAQLRETGSVEDFVRILCAEAEAM
jgi:mannitol/fructose-specific phosphotransferase system IIA component (Ntr-type)